MSVGSFLFGGKPNYTANPHDSQLAHGDYYRDMSKGYINQVDNRNAPQATETGFYRNAQTGLVQDLQGVASGQQAGAGELAARRAISRALASQQGMVAGARGGNAALAQREAARNSVQLGVQGAGQYQQAAMNDQTQARGLLGQVAGQARGQDQAMAMANMNAQLQARGMDDAQRVALMSQLFGIDQAEMAARMQQAQAVAAAGKSGGLAGDLMQAGSVLGAAYLTGGASLAVPAAQGVRGGGQGAGSPAPGMSQQQYYQNSQVQPYGGQPYTLPPNLAYVRGNPTGVGA